MWLIKEVWFDKKQLDSRVFFYIKFAVKYSVLVEAYEAGLDARTWVFGDGRLLRSFHSSQLEPHFQNCWSRKQSRCRISVLIRLAVTAHDVTRKNSY